MGDRNYNTRRNNTQIDATVTMLHNSDSKANKRQKKIATEGQTTTRSETNSELSKEDSDDIIGVKNRKKMLSKLSPK